MTKGSVKNGQPQWRSLSSRTNPDQGSVREFPEGAENLELDGVSRRQFLAIMGASTALAGGLTGCVRKEVEHILPYSHRPEDQADGEARFFATNLYVGGVALGLLVKSQDGRPSKVEGNKEHPSSGGGTNVFAQATVLDVYDPDRSRHALKAGAASTLEEALAAVDAALVGHKGAGQGLAIVIDSKPSPSNRALLASIAKGYAAAQIYTHDNADQANTREGMALVGVASSHPVYDLSVADVVVSLDADFMGTGVDSVRLTRQFAGRRKPEAAKAGEINRLYAIEPAFTVTGATADNRLQVPASQVGTFARLLASKLAASGVTLPAGAEALGGTAVQADETLTKWADAVAKDLAAKRGKAVIIVGERQPAWVHGLAHLMNVALDGLTKTFSIQPDAGMVQTQNSEKLAEALNKGEVKTLILIGVNPVYDAPGALNFGQAIAKAPLSIHLGYHADETAKAASWHIPMSHALESWGDLLSWDGTLGIQQPLIAPLFESISDIELIGRIAGKTGSGYDLVRDQWKSAIPGDFETAWRRSLHSGKFATPTGAVTPTWDWAPLAAQVAKETTSPAPTKAALEAVFALDNKTYDGRFANNAWLQELPDPVTKLTWDNAAMVSPKTARELGLRFGSGDDTGKESSDLVKLTVDGREVTIAVLVTPGVADFTILVPMGYGRSFGGRVAADKVGFNTHPLRSTMTTGFLAGATVAKSGGTYLLALTQDHNTMRGDSEAADRPILRHAEIEEFTKNPKVIAAQDLMKPEDLESLWDKSDGEFTGPPMKYENNEKYPHQWGMVIDLTSCTGCNVCTIACQAENNIPVVGKERVLNGREMHWIRLDRYFVGDDENSPKLMTQPMGCAHCETAPCEQVCPVAATVHGPEGTNDMAYNRCVGTRYCSNNCPLKVRRFNFFNYNKEADTSNELLRMQRNNNVTVRFRGVMEKCTYCTQRISAARIDAKVHGNGIIQEGAFTSACAQACPAEAITFGNIAAPDSRVSVLKKMDQNYAVLEWLNLRPRTTYLAKISNPNPELG
jgi:molybdopterin-containing oxidoreductase family iron-sulfur binding subunit